MDIKDILARCDHTLLRTDCTAAEIRALCDDAIRFGCASVCIPPAHVAGAKRYVNGQMKICTVIGFPNGYNTTAAKVFETEDAVKNGADEIDMVINLGMVKDKCWDMLLDEIVRIKAACGGKLLKVIIECCLLTDEEKIKLCEIVSASGAEYIKTSTGFSKRKKRNKKETGKKRFFPVSVCRKSPASAGLFLQAENTLCILRGFDAV